MLENTGCGSCHEGMNYGSDRNFWHCVADFVSEIYITRPSGLSRGIGPEHAMALRRARTYTFLSFCLPQTTSKLRVRL
jgi:hypothetical protein